MDAEKDFTRPEGVYCHWESYPSISDVVNNILVIERVNGDYSVTKLSCARSEARAIQAFLNQSV